MTENVNELLDLLIALDGISARTYEIPKRSQDRRALARGAPLTQLRPEKSANVDPGLAFLSVPGRLLPLWRQTTRKGGAAFRWQSSKLFYLRRLFYA